MKIDQNAEKSPGDLRWFAVTQTHKKTKKTKQNKNNNQLTLVLKTLCVKKTIIKIRLLHIQPKIHSQKYARGTDHIAELSKTRFLLSEFLSIARKTYNKLTYKIFFPHEFFCCTNILVSLHLSTNMSLQFQCFIYFLLGNKFRLCYCCNYGVNFICLIGIVLLAHPFFFFLCSLIFLSHLVNCPVGWGCRIHRLHLCRGVRPHPTSVLIWH